MQDQIGFVYLLHFSRAYKHAKHYIGWTSNLEQRIERHRTGYAGSRLINVIHKEGITFEVAQTWKDVTRAFERKLKKRGGASRICPICLQQNQLSSK